jgi:peroxiredoxin
MSRAFAGTLVIGAALALAACGGGGGETPAAKTASGSEATTGSDAVDFTLTDIDGREQTLSKYLGKGPVLLSFWATWCKPCLAEMEHLETMYEAKKDKGFVVLAISLDGPETEASVLPTARSKGWTFPVAVDTETRATSLYNPRRAQPFSVLIDKHGKIVLRRENYNPGDEKALEAEVDKALAAP